MGIGYQNGAIAVPVQTPGLHGVVAIAGGLDEDYAVVGRS